MTTKALASIHASVATTSDTAQILRWAAYCAAALLILAAVLYLSRRRHERRAQHIRNRNAAATGTQQFHGRPKSDGHKTAQQPQARPAQEARGMSEWKAGGMAGRQRWVIVDALPVMFGRSDSIENDLVPFVTKTLGSAQNPLLAQILKQVRLGETGTEELWRNCNILAPADIIDLAYIKERHPIPDSVESLKKLFENGTRVIAISNDSTKWAAQTRTLLEAHGAGLLTWFESAAAGTQIGTSTFFETLAQHYKIGAQDCVTVSSEHQTLRAAQSVGFTPVMFSSETATKLSEDSGQTPFEIIDSLRQLAF